MNGEIAELKLEIRRLKCALTWHMSREAGTLMMQSRIFEVERILTADEDTLRGYES